MRPSVYTLWLGSQGTLTQVFSSLIKEKTLIVKQTLPLLNLFWPCKIILLPFSLSKAII